MKKLIVTGASGFLGYHLIRLAAKDWEVYGFSHQSAISFDNLVALKVDITNYLELGDLVEDIEPDAVIHAAAISDANYCEQNSETSFAVNVEATKNIAGICADYHIPLAFTSTDLVFDGKQGNYGEDAERNPVSVYGEQKALAEDELLKIYPEGSVFRLPLMFGNPQASQSNYLRKFLSQISNREVVKLFHDECRSVCGASSIAAGILQLLGHSTGIIHLGGIERLSRFGFGKRIAKAFSLDATLLQSCSQKDLKMSAPRPADVSLDSSKAFNLGYAPLKAGEELRLIAENNYL